MDTMTLPVHVKVKEILKEMRVKQSTVISCDVKHRCEFWTVTNVNKGCKTVRVNILLGEGLSPKYIHVDWEHK